MSCGCGKKKCNGKCGISPSVLQINNNECTLFHKVEIPAVMGDETTNPPKTGAYRNVLLYYEASGNSYLYSSDGIPTKLTGVVSDYEVLTNKPSINGVVLIKNKTLADLGIISAIDSAVADEATARTNADNALSDRITTNANNIAANATAISNEVTARTNADNTLSARISGNTTAINNEKTARENADTALSNRITANANAISAETTARENADNALSGRITANAEAISSEKTARENADADLQDQITAVKATADSAVQPDDIDKTVMSDLAVDSNSSTAQVILKESKVNLKTGATSSEQTSLPVASSSQAGVMNSATYDAVTSNTSNINAIMNGAVAITGLPANPSQSDLTTAWQNETGLSTLINRASVYDVTNNKVWTYYTNDTTWHAASNTSSVTVNTFTNSSEGTIKGSTNIGQVFAENDGTGSVNGWDALSDAVSNNTSKLAGIESGAEVNVQSDWNVSDSSSDAYIKNKPTIGNATLTIQKNGTTIDTFTANSTTNKTVNITVPTVNDATLTIQKNGDTVQTFTANSSSNKTANIEVPTKTSELDNDAGFIANDTHQVCGEGGNITLDTTTFEPLEMNHLGGNTEQQTYIGKNLLEYVPKSGSSQGLTSTYDSATGAIHVYGTTTNTYSDISSRAYETLPAGTYTFSVNKSQSNINISVRLYLQDTTYVNKYISAGSTSITFTIDQPVESYYVYVWNNSWSSTSIDSTFTLQLESGSSATSYEPYVGGIASPNPDYPQAVNTVTGENVVKINGKNLLPIEINSQTVAGITMTKNADGSLTFNGTATGSAYFNLNNSASGWVHLESGKTYTLSATTPLPTNTRLCCRNATGSTVNYIDVDGGNQTSKTTTMAVDDNTFTYFAVYGAGTVVNNLTIYPMLELGSTATEYQPYQSQSYEVNLGKNLYNSVDGTVSSSGITVTRSGGLMGISGTVTDSWGFNIEPGNTAYTQPLAPGVYTVSINKVVNFNVKLNFKKADGYSPVIATIPAGSRSTTVAISDTIVYHTLWSNSTTGTVVDVQGFGVQIEKGSQATSYAAYFTPIELCKIGDYQDYIYKSGGKWYVRKEVGKHLFDGSETFTSDSSYSGIYQYRWTDSSVINTSSQDAICALSDKFYGRSYRNSWGYDFSVVPRINANALRFMTSLSSTIGAFQTWLASNPTTVYYALATPTDTEITNEALVAQLENLWDADGVEGETNIALTYAKGNAQGILSVCQYPSHLPVATKSKLGTIIVGHGLDIEDDGRLDVIVDSALSDSSINPVQNKAITTELNNKADISSVPTKTSQLENDSGFVVNDTTEICDEGSDITLNGTLLEPLDVKKIDGATSQQTYTGKNLLPIDFSDGSGGGLTWKNNGDGTITVSGTTTMAYAVNISPSSTQTLKLQNGKTYTQRVEVVSGNFTMRVVPSFKNSGGTLVYNYFTNNQTKTATDTMTCNAYDLYAPDSGIVANFTIRVWLEEGSDLSSPYEPYVGGIASPNPDYPQAVNTVTGEQTIAIRGKNLLKLPSAGTSAGVAYSVNSDGTFNVHGTNNSGYEILFSLYLDSGEFQSVDYTLGAREALPYGLGCRCEIYRGGTWKRSFVTVNSTRQTQTGTPDFTDANRVRVAITIANGATVNIDNVGIQLELGSSASSFEPYQGQSYPISLGSIELCGLGDDGAGGYLYKDSIYKNLTDNKWYVHKECAKSVLNGSEPNWATQTSGGLRRYSVNRTDSKSFPSRTSDASLSSHFTPSVTDAVGIFFVATQTYYFYPDQSIATLDSWKSWLASNNVALYYPLATPTDTEITNEALVAQLENLWDADGVEGETNIFTASDGVNERAILSVCQYPSHLPIATKTKLGTIVVGHGLDIEADGKLDVIVDDDFSTESDHPVQNKVITNALAGKADNTDLSTVAMTGSYDDLTGKPTIPTVNNATLTIQKNGTNVATFTANSSTNVTANITAPVVTMTTTDPGEGGALAANNFIGVYV